MVPNPGRVSIIVPTRNSIRTIQACLESARAQQVAEVEVIVVDNFSTDGTAEVGKRLADVFVQAGPERSAQRNIGAIAATGEFVVFIDSDMVLEPTVACELVDTFNSSAELQALVIPEVSFGEGFWASCRALEKRLYLDASDVEAARAFRHATFIELGGYSESLTGPEDWELPDRLRTRGGQIGRIDARVCHDEGVLTLRNTLSKKFYYGRSVPEYLRRHPATARRRFLRAALMRQPKRLAQHPVTSAGLLVLKALEGSAMAAGMVVGRPVSARCRT